MADQRDEHEYLTSCLIRIQELEARLEAAPEKVAARLFYRRRGLEVERLEWGEIGRDVPGYTRDEVERIIRKALEEEDSK